MSAALAKRTAYFLIAAGIVLMVFGIFRGEMSTVFMKAAKICLECIGIG